MGVLAARGSQLEREFAYGVVRQLFEPVLAAASPAEREELLGGAAGQAAVLLGQADHGLVSAGGGGGSFAVLHGLFWLVANLCAQRPVVLVVDDLHWADVWSLRFLAYLLPRLDGLPLLVMVALRPGEPAADQHLLAQIVTDPSARLIQPAPLSQAASAQLIRSVLTDEVSQEFCAACYAATGGNPLLVRELAAAAAAEGVPPNLAEKGWLAELAPQAVGRRVALRLAQLGPAAAALARAVAVLAEDADPVQAAGLAGLEVEEAFEAASQLTAVEILRPRSPSAEATSGRRLGFVHPLVQAAVYGGLSEAERIQGHVCAARLLVEAGAAAEQVAAHLLIVSPGDDPRAVATLREAAEQALIRGAPDSAVVYLERCLAEPPSPLERVEVLIQLGTVAQLVDMTKAAKHLRAALALVQQPEQRAVVAEMLGHVLFFLESYEDAVAVYTQAVETLPEEHFDLRRRLQAGIIDAALADPTLLGLAAEWTGRLRDAPPDDSLGSRMLDCMIAAYDAWTGKPAAAAVTRARRGLAGGRVLEQASALMASVHACGVLMVAGQDEVTSLLDALLAQAHRRGSLLDLAGAKCFRALGWLWRGFLPEAEADAHDAVRVIQTAHIDVGRPCAAAFLADALMEQGRLEEAEAALNWAGPIDCAPQTGHWHWTFLSRAHLLILQKRIEEGLEALLACGERLAARGWHNPAFIPWRSDAALALLSLGRREQARALAVEELQLVRRWGAPRPLGRSLRVAGMVEGGQEGLALLRQAVDVLAPSPARLEYAKALIELGAALRRANQRVKARQYLRQGIDQVELCGATPLVERGLAELRASGARPRRTRLSGPAALTPSERRVAELAAAGSSNRDIAQTLFVTVHTVELHLTRAYRKLGITSRTELAHSLAAPNRS